MLNRIARKLFKKWFTAQPYKIEQYSVLFEKATGECVDVPESFNNILKTEAGDQLYYPTLRKPITGQPVGRFLADKPRFKAKGFFKEPERVLYSMENGCLLGHTGLVYDNKSRSFIGESAKEWTVDLDNSPFVNMVNLPERQYLKGVTLSCLTIGADYGFYHFLFESVVKIYFAASLLGNVNHILINGPATEWKEKWLKRADLDFNKIIWVTPTDHFECEQLLFTSTLVADQQINPWAISALKGLFKIQDEPNSLMKNMVLISRKGLGIREILWEDALLNEFLEITRVNLHDTHVAETIKIMQNASHVISAHGAGLSNNYLCRPGTKILEIYPEGMPLQPLFFRLSEMCRLQHQIMYADFNDPIKGLNTFKEAYSKFI
ncbi:MAG: glycosyltransferase family 61 protein [Chryseobacterium sp.]|nr:MAG: glycosyltransferase family 61 protein [Chryseobacterium sp.]